MKKTVFQLNGLLKDRAIKTMVLALVLIILMGSSQPPVTSGIYPNEYWAQKSDWHHCADVVLAGDSRILCGVSPKEMQQYMPGYKVLNYGFGGAWFSTQYLDKVETILNPQSNKKTIVAGISPHSLTRREVGTGNFFEVMSMTKSEKFFNTHLARLAYFFEPLSFEDAIKQMHTSREDINNKEAYYPDGWISGHEIPGSIEKELKKYIGFYNERLVDPCNVENIAVYVEKWIKQGIKVYGFMPPSCQEMYDLEMKISGIDKPYLVRRFQESGGIWIETDPAGYVSFDGTHLQRKAALEFSKYLATKIKDIEQQKIITSFSRDYIGKENIREVK